MKELTAQVRIEVEGQNEFIIVPMWRTAEGGVITPSEGAHIIHKGLSYRIVDVTWNYDQDSIIAYARPINDERSLVDDLSNAKGIITALDKYQRIADEKIDKGVVMAEHQWKKTDKGEIDEMAYESYDIDINADHYGPKCTVCRFAECMSCISADGGDVYDVEKNPCPGPPPEGHYWYWFYYDEKPHTRPELSGGKG